MSWLRSVGDIPTSHESPSVCRPAEVEAVTSGCRATALRESLVRTHQPPNYIPIVQCSVDLYLLIWFRPPQLTIENILFWNLEIMKS